MSRKQDTPNMQTTRIFQSGKSQAVRLPKAFAFRSSLVYIERRGNEVVLREGPIKLAEVIKGLPRLPNDFPDDINELEIEQRELLCACALKNGS